MWDEQVSAFAPRYRVIAPDARGHGQSSTPTAFPHCDDLAVLLRHLDLGPAILVGLSMGGGTAVDTTLEYPELVRVLAVSGTGTSEPNFQDPWVQGIVTEWVRTQAARDLDGWIDAFLLLACGPHRPLVDVDSAIVRPLREMATHTVTEHAASGPPPLVPVTDTWARIQRITQPVLAVIGDLDSDDHIGDSDDHIGMAERLARTVPNGREHGATGRVQRESRRLLGGGTHPNRRAEGLVRVWRS
jgi:pimeloyl-ACP methyl ester carboxylesterase